MPYTILLTYKSYLRNAHGHDVVLLAKSEQELTKVVRDWKKQQKEYDWKSSKKKNKYVVLRKNSQQGPKK